MSFLLRIIKKKTVNVKQRPIKVFGVHYLIFRCHVAVHTSEVLTDMIFNSKRSKFYGNDTFWKIASFVLENFRSDGVFLVSTPDNIGYFSGYVDFFIRNTAIQI